jgi:hypothetical protein
MTTDEPIIDYLRARGRERPPDGFVSSVMAAIDDPGPSRSPFAAWMPAVAIATGVAVIAAVALFIGQGPNVGPGPSPATNSPTPSASVEPTIDDLGVALLDAVDVLRAAPGVEGRQQVEIDGVIGAVTWFDWRANGDQVLVQRQDLDVTETGWWMVTDGAPPATGQRIYTFIQAKVGDESFFTNEAGDWQVAARDDGFRTGALGLAILDGAILPWRPLDGLVSSLDDPSEARIERDDLPDGGVEWQLESEWTGAPLIQRWTIGPGGELRSWTFEREDRSVDPDGDFNANATHGWLQYTITDGDPIEPPDVERVPDPASFGLPADFPLGPGIEAEIDYRAYVEAALDALEAYHWNSANIDWATARAAALDGLPAEPTQDQAHARIQRAIGTFDAFNTVLVRPRDVPPGGQAGGDASFAVPSVERIGAVAHLALPAPGGSDDLADYVGAAAEAMAAAETAEPACGWVVDLRDYDGGAWGPPMLATAGLLGDGRAVTFRSPAGEWWLEIDDAGVVTADGFDAADDKIDSPYIATYGAEIQRDRSLASAIGEEASYRPAGDVPVALLVGNGTISGGEQTLVAFLGRESTRTFGAPTGGRPIVAPNVEMADGAVLRIPTWVPVDRDGTAHAANVMPDELIGDTRATGSDAILEAALAWLQEQPGCS